MIALLLALHIDMYQDRIDPNKTVIIIEQDGMVETCTVTYKELLKFDKEKASEIKRCIKKSSSLLL